jgi:hypothetical protein
VQAKSLKSIQFALIEITKRRILEMEQDWERIGEGDISEEIISPEEKEALLRTIEITKEVFGSPRQVKPAHIYYAIEGWQNLEAHLADSQIADLVGEVIELLDEVFRKKHISFDEAQRGKEKVKILVHFLGLSGRRGQEIWD